MDKNDIRLKVAGEEGLNRVIGVDAVQQAGNALAFYIVGIRPLGSGDVSSALLLRVEEAAVPAAAALLRVEEAAPDVDERPGGGQL